MNPRSIGVAIGSALAGGLLLFLLVRQSPTVPPTTPRPDAAPTAAKASNASRPNPFEERDRTPDDEDASERPTAPVQALAGVPTPAAPERREDPEAPPAAAPPLPPPSPTVEVAMVQANVAAKAAVDKAQPKLRRECWDTLANRPDAAQVEFSLSYDADGNVIASAVQQGRENYNAELGTCLGKQATALKIEAPGEPVSLNVAVDFP